MATYKVPQDVEADDKLLGPFSFRQFVYLVIVALAVGFAWLLGQIFIGLIVIPMPLIFFFGALALPLKKDQPMEAYLGAMISFYFIKPRKRLWVPDGIESLVEITAPRQVEPERVKNISQREAAARLSYLADIIDSRGWAVRGTGVPTHGVSSMNNAMYQEAKNATDMFENNEAEARRFDRLIEERQQKSQQHSLASLNQQIEQSRVADTTPVVATADDAALPPIPNLGSNTPPDTPLSSPTFEPPTQPAMQDTSTITSSPGIIKLANNSEGLTVADVAKQAERIRFAERGLPDNEVNISLH